MTETKTQETTKQVAERITPEDVMSGYTRGSAVRDVNVPNRTDSGGTRKLEQRNYRGEHVDATVTLPLGMLRHIKFIPADHPKPAYDHVKHMGVDIHLRDGVKPDPQTGEIHGRVEVKVRKLAQKNGKGKTNLYFYLNIFPLKDGAKPKRRITIERLYADESAYETIFVPKPDQENQQAYVCVAPLPAPAAASKS